jgi:glycosyltransferase involved in cell wall biosynthesis
LKTEGRLSPQTFLLGICATNTPRKDWGLAFETCAELKVRGEPIGIWAHTDRITGAWDLEAMVKSFGLRDDIQFTIGNLSDEDMAWGLSACDVVLGIGAGEGWGLVNSESLACGVPCISFDYAGVKEFTHPDLLIKPASWRWDGFFCNQRPIGSASEWADRAVAVKGKLFDLDPQFYWDNCWPRWEAWLKEGL